MKLTFGGYEVEINAKRSYRKDYNDNDTMMLLNRISIAFAEAGRYNIEHFNFDDGYEEIADEIFRELETR